MAGPWEWPGNREQQARPTALSSGSTQAREFSRGAAKPAGGGIKAALISPGGIKGYASRSQQLNGGMKRVHT